MANGAITYEQWEQWTNYFSNLPEDKTVPLKHFTRMKPNTLIKEDNQIEQALVPIKDWSHWMIGRVVMVLLRRLRRETIELAKPSPSLGDINSLFRVGTATTLIEKEFGWTGDDPDEPYQTEEQLALHAVSLYLQYADDDTRGNFFAKAFSTNGPRDHTMTITQP